VAFNVDVRDKLVASLSPPSETKELILRVIEVSLEYCMAGLETLENDTYITDVKLKAFMFALANFQKMLRQGEVNVLTLGFGMVSFMC
jgi:hypothetical protein